MHMLDVWFDRSGRDLTMYAHNITKASTSDSFKVLMEATFDVVPHTSWHADSYAASDHLPTVRAMHGLSVHLDKGRAIWTGPMVARAVYTMTPTVPLAAGAEARVEFTMPALPSSVRDYRCSIYAQRDSDFPGTLALLDVII